MANGQKAISNLELRIGDFFCAYLLFLRYAICNILFAQYHLPNAIHNLLGEDPATYGTHRSISWSFL